MVWEKTSCWIKKYFEHHLTGICFLVMVFIWLGKYKNYLMVSRLGMPLEQHELSNQGAPSFDSRAPLRLRAWFLTYTPTGALKSILINTNIRTHLLFSILLSSSLSSTELHALRSAHGKRPAQQEIRLMGGDRASDPDEQRRAVGRRPLCPAVRTP